MTAPETSYSVNKLVEMIKAGNITLPTIQRGFVWKSYQIENFWDSVLRGYPLGAFTAGSFSPGKIEILDGQQRATALALAFDTRSEDCPFESIDKNNSEGNILNANYNNWQIYIDLLKPSTNEGDDRKFLFRIITKSHPWGFDLRDNRKKLEKGIHDARDAYRERGIISNEKEYFMEDLRSFYPWSAVAPVPFRFFLKPDVINFLEKGCEATAVPLVVNHIKSWLKNDKNTADISKNLPKILKETFYREAHGNNSIFSGYRNHFRHPLPEDDIYDENGQAKYFYTIEEIAEAVRKFVISFKNIAIFTPKVLADASGANSADVENIFVRINTGGTRISNNELNYSLLKFNLKDTDFIKKMESRCNKVMSPAVFIAIAYRLYKVIHGIGRESLSLEISPRQFGAELNEPISKKSEITILEHFKQFLNKYFLNEENKIDFINFKSGSPDYYKIDDRFSLFTIYERLLKYKEIHNENGFPSCIFLTFASQKPELVFLLWYGLITRGLPSDHDQITEVISVLFFFSHSKSLEYCWAIAKSKNFIDADRFWGAELLERALNLNLGYATGFPPNPYLDTQQKKHKEFLMKNTAVVNNLCNRNLVLFAQRKYIEKWFGALLTELDDVMLDDMNTPYDFDHILPSSFIYYKGFEPEFKNLYNSIGNLRAWPYSLNRRDQDKGLPYKFDPLHEMDESTKNMWKGDYDFYFGEYAEEYLKKCNGNLREATKQLLLDASCCTEPFWGDEGFLIDGKNIINENEKNKIIEAITDRIILLYKSWFDTIKLVFPKYNIPDYNNSDDLEVFLKTDCFKSTPEIINPNDDTHVIDIFSFKKNYPMQHLLTEHNIKLRISCNHAPVGKLPEYYNWRQTSENAYYVLFTLQSSSLQSKIELFAEIFQAIKILYPDLAEKFHDLLAPELNKAITLN